MNWIHTIYSFTGFIMPVEWRLYFPGPASEAKETILSVVRCLFIASLATVWRLGPGNSLRVYAPDNAQYCGNSYFDLPKRQMVLHQIQWLRHNPLLRQICQRKNKALATVSLGLEIPWQNILVEFAAPSVGNVYLNRRIMLPLLQQSVNSCSMEYLFSYQLEYTPNSALR